MRESIVIGHQNLCEHAEDMAALYRLWDDDLKKTMRRRQLREAAGMSSLIASYVSWKIGYLDFGAVCFLLAIGLMFIAIKFMIDESNMNYLMHPWDFARRHCNVS